MRAQTSPTPLPSASPSATAVPPAQVGGAFAIAAFHSTGINATGALDTASGRDATDRGDLANLLLNVSIGSGRLRESATLGTYAFPTVGQAINQTLQAGANTSLYSAVPLAQVSYAMNAHVTVAAGKFAALLGAESPFTYQNFNVQRGLGWALEPTISRGLQASYANGALSATFQLNDAYYSGSARAVEALIGYSATPENGVSLAAIFPSRDLGPNPTTAIGNKTEYNLLYARQFGKLQIAPYLLWVNSPSSAVLGYPRNERATAIVAMASYAFSAPISVAVRYEDLRNSSAVDDAAPNADLIGYGAGSAARTLTITPAWHASYGLFRFEYSHVWLSRFASGGGFGNSGDTAAQDRFGLEIGLIR